MESDLLAYFSASARFESALWSLSIAATTLGITSGQVDSSAQPPGNPYGDSARALRIETLPVKLAPELSLDLVPPCGERIEDGLVPVLVREIDVQLDPRVTLPHDEVPPEGILSFSLPGVVTRLLVCVETSDLLLMDL